MAQTEQKKEPLIEQHPLPAELTVVIPCFNEHSNIQPMISALESALYGIRWEVIFVDDDSPDGTAAEVRRLAETDSRVRCLHRIGRRGLSSASVEGMQASAAPFVAVMDADLQHDETLLHQMLNLLKSGEYDIVIGSRYVQGGSSGRLGESRLRISQMACRLAERLLKTQLADPMSGFFMMTRQLLEQTVHRLSGRGFKILLDIVASSEGRSRLRELPYTMRARSQGDSKLDAAITLEYFILLLEKWLGGFLPIRFLMFLMVGAVGVGVHISVLALLHLSFGQVFAISQAIATLVAMTSNFLLNNLFTYRDRRLHGVDFLKGLFSFYVACSIGALLNVVLADFLFNHEFHWISAGLAGAAVGAVWNYLVTALFTWKVKSSDSG